MGASAQAPAAVVAKIEAAVAPPLVGQDASQAAEEPDAEPQPDAAQGAPAFAAAVAREANAPTAPAESRATPATVQSLAAEVVRRLDQRVSRFEVALNPAGLGRVDVSLQIGAQGRLTAALSFDRPQSAAELKARAPELESALRDAGFDIATGDIRFTQADAGLSGESGGRAARDFAESQGSRRPSGANARAFGAAADLGEPSPIRSRRALSALDIQV